MIDRDEMLPATRRRGGLGMAIRGPCQDVWSEDALGTSTDGDGSCQMADASCPLDREAYGAETYDAWIPCVPGCAVEEPTRW